MSQPQPIQLVEVNLTEAQLKEALEKLQNSNSGTVTVVSSLSRFVGVDTSGGFELKPSNYQCMYGKQSGPDVREALNDVQ